MCTNRSITESRFLNVFCYRNSDVTLNGYHIPTGAQIIPLQHFVHNDPKLWDEPEAFKPERFINAEGKVKKPDCFLPFGVGKIFIFQNGITVYDLCIYI